MKHSASRWTAIGWRNLFVEAPEDWSIGALSGDDSAGYLRIDDAEMPRIELRWEPVRGQEPIEKVVDRYLAKLTEKKGKKTTPVKVRRQLNLIKEASILENRTIEGFHWETEGDRPLQAYGILWRCSVCKRTVFVQVIGQEHESIFSIAARVLNSLRDHPEGEMTTWGLYGMRFETPATFVLKDYQLLTGRLALRFSGTAGEIEIERLSLAEIQLDDKPFEHWFQQTCDGEILHQETLSGEGFRHPGVWASGKAIDPATVHKRMAWLPWRRPKKREFERIGWHCADGNKLFTLRRLTDQTDQEVLSRIARTMVCH